MLDSGIFHAADPQPFDREFAACQTVYTAKDCFSLAPCVTGIYHIIKIFASEELLQDIEMRFLIFRNQQLPFFRENWKIIEPPAFIAFIVILRGCILCQMPQTPAHHAVPTLQIPVLMFVCTDHFRDGTCHTRLFCYHKIFHVSSRLFEKAGIVRIRPSLHH